jgi:hypothetical protein
MSKLPKLPNFCHPVEWAIQSPYPMCHLKSPNCQNYPISVIWLSGRFNHPTQFATWNLQFAKITQFLSPSWVGDPITLPNLPPDIFKLPHVPSFCQFATWNLQIAKISWFLSPGWVDNSIILPNLLPEISKLPKLPDFSHPVEWAIQLPNPICHLKYPNSQIYPIFVNQLSGWSNYPTRFPTWNLQIAKSPHLCYPVCVGDLITHPDLPTDTHCHKYPISVT